MRSVMVFDVKPGERLQLGEVIVEALHKTGRVARLRISAPREVQITKTKPGTEEISAPDRCGVVPSTAP